MRFQHTARRIFLAPALGLALAAAVAACSSSSSSSTPAASASSAAPAASSPAAGSGGSAATIAAIKANWEAFFSSSTPADKRVQLLQNGETFSAAIKALASSPLASAASAKVVSVTVNSDTKATVKYNIVAGGQPVLSGVTGVAVYEDGMWKVGDASLCGLLKLQGGQLPSACNSAG